MPAILIAGIIIVHLALISYGIAIFTQSWKRKMSSFVLIFLSLGVILDITATVCMIIGSPQGGLTLHGIIGYSSLAGMLIDTVQSYRFTAKHGIGATTSAGFNKWSRYAYYYWIAAYITGAVLVMVK